MLRIYLKSCITCSKNLLHTIYYTLYLYLGIIVGPQQGISYLNSFFHLCGVVHHDVAVLPHQVDLLGISVQRHVFRFESFLSSVGMVRKYWSVSWDGPGGGVRE